MAALALAGGMMLMQAPVPVFAETPTAGPGTEGNPASVTINKHLQMPEGTTTPVGTSTFNFTAVSVDGAAATGGNMPQIPARTVTFAASDAGTAAGGIKTVMKETGNIVDGVTFPHAGEYIYNVTEAASGFTLTSDSDIVETMDYSTKTYQVQVIAVNNAAGTGTYVQSISVNNFDPSTPTVLGTKVNDGDEAEGTSFAFDNKFTRTHLNDATNPGDTNDTNLRIQKKVAGAGGDLNQYFDFSATLTAPALVTSATPSTYHAVIMEGGAAIDPTDNGITGAGSDHKFAVTPGTALSFKLKHNQQLVLLDAPVGSSYVASETSVPANYTATHKQTINGMEESEASGSSVASTQIGEATNHLLLTNTRQEITPTGIVVSNLPYVLLGALGLAGFGFLMSRRHRRNA